MLHHESWVASLEPRNPAEAQIVREIAAGYWKLLRLETMEHDLLAAKVEELVRNSKQAKDLSVAQGALQAAEYLVANTAGLVFAEYHASMDTLLLATSAAVNLLDGIENFATPALSRLKSTLASIKADIILDNVTYPTDFPCRIATATGPVILDLQSLIAQIQRDLVTIRSSAWAEALSCADVAFKKLDRYRGQIEASIQRQLFLLASLRDLPAPDSSTTPISVEFSVLQL